MVAFSSTKKAKERRAMFGVIVLVIGIVLWLYIHIHDGVTSIQQSKSCMGERVPFYLDSIGDTLFWRYVPTAEKGMVQSECNEQVFYSDNGKYINPFQERRYKEYLRFKEKPTTDQKYYLVDRWGYEREHSRFLSNQRLSNPGVRLLPVHSDLPVAVILECQSLDVTPQGYCFYKKRYYMDAEKRTLLFPVEGSKFTAREDRYFRTHWKEFICKPITDWSIIKDIYEEQGLVCYSGHDQNNYDAVDKEVC